MQNGLAPHLRVAAKNLEGYLSCEESPLEEQGTQTHTGFPNPDYWCWEEEPPRLAVKNCGDFNHPGETKTLWETQMPS